MTRTGDVPSDVRLSVLKAVSGFELPKTFYTALLSQWDEQAIEVVLLAPQAATTDLPRDLAVALCEQAQPRMRHPATAPLAFRLTDRLFRSRTMVKDWLRNRRDLVALIRSQDPEVRAKIAQTIASDKSLVKAYGDELDDD